MCYRKLGSMILVTHYAGVPTSADVGSVLMPAVCFVISRLLDKDYNKGRATLGATNEHPQEVPCANSGQIALIQPLALVMLYNMSSCPWKGFRVLEMALPSTLIILETSMFNVTIMG